MALPYSHDSLLLQCFALAAFFLCHALRLAAIHRALEYGYLQAHPRTRYLHLLGLAKLPLVIAQVLPFDLASACASATDEYMPKGSRINMPCWLL